MARRHNPLQVMDFWNYWKAAFLGAWASRKTDAFIRGGAVALIAPLITPYFGVALSKDWGKVILISITSGFIWLFLDFLFRTLFLTPPARSKEQAAALLKIKSDLLELQKENARLVDGRKASARAALSEFEIRWRGMRTARMNAAHCVGSRLALTEFFADSFSKPTKVSSLKGQSEVNEVLVFLDEFCEQEAELEMEPAKVFYSAIFPAAVAYSQALKHEIGKEIAKQPSRFKHIKATCERYSALFPKEIASMNVDSILLSEQNGPPGNFGAVTI